jgi:hypothetical protein
MRGNFPLFQLPRLLVTYFQLLADPVDTYSGQAIKRGREGQNMDLVLSADEK